MATACLGFLNFNQFFLSFLFKWKCAAISVETKNSACDLQLLLLPWFSYLKSSDLLKELRDRDCRLVTDRVQLFIPYFWARQDNKPFVIVQSEFFIRK